MAETTFHEKIEIPSHLQDLRSLSVHALAEPGQPADTFIVQIYAVGVGHDSVRFGINRESAMRFVELLCAAIAAPAASDEPSPAPSEAVEAVA